uniref:Uncharacterized protein n=1 Tax=Ficedula albicollis TaxID=59894 RepID=A0A803V7B4_FICAL
MCNSISVYESVFFALLAKYNARPSQGGEDWAHNNWFNLKNVIDRIHSLQHETKFKLGKNKTILCSVLGACLKTAIETRFISEERAIIDSLQNVVEIFQKQLDEERNDNHALRDETHSLRNENHSLTAALRQEHTNTLKHTDLPKEREEKETNQIYPQKEVTLMKNNGEYCCPSLRPLVKTEDNFINDENFNPQITTTKILGHWGLGALLTMGDKFNLWSPIQHAVFWARGLNPLERGDLVTLVDTPDQLLENIQKAACLQIIHEIKFTAGHKSPMQLPVNVKQYPLPSGAKEGLKLVLLVLQNSPVWPIQKPKPVNVARVIGQNKREAFTRTLTQGLSPGLAQQGLSLRWPSADLGALGWERQQGQMASTCVTLQMLMEQRASVTQPQARVIGQNKREAFTRTLTQGLSPGLAQQGLSLRWPSADLGALGWERQQGQMASTCVTLQMLMEQRASVTQQGLMETRGHCEPAGL